MEITEVRIRLNKAGGERLYAICSITFDHCFVIRDLKIVEGPNGAFVAMPSRKLTANCPRCGRKNHLRSGYCNQCGTRQREDHARQDEDGPIKLFADVAHPIKANFRDLIEDRVIREYRTALEREKRSGQATGCDDPARANLSPPLQPRIKDHTLSQTVSALSVAAQPRGAFCDSLSMGLNSCEPSLSGSSHKTAGLGPGSLDS